MQNLQNKYLSKKCKIRDPSTYFVKICRAIAGQVLISLIFESRRTNLCGLVKDFEKAWPWYHDGLPIAPLCA